MHKGQDMIMGATISRGCISYKDMRNARFLSQDGLAQVRMGDSDILVQYLGVTYMIFDTSIQNLKLFIYF